MPCLKRAAVWVVLLSSISAPQEPARAPFTREQAEKRFPPLQLPSGFKAALFACDPLIEYPSVIALGPRVGSAFVPYDYMTGLGTEIVRRDEVKLVEDTDGDGFADRATFYAGGFNSIQGLAFHDGTVYVMHAPYLTALRDTNGDGAGDERRDLFKGLGWEPEKAPDRLHMANGVTVGHDGWLYLSLGDRGVDTVRPEGDRLVLNSGGILRCRPDGKDLHVFSYGLRNIYDVALDEELNVFVRDNENDGGTYMIRVCLSVFGADHGYPYLYEEHADELLTPLADLARGSSAGGACYLEPSFPPEYQGDLFFCEWGRSVVRYRRERSGATFGTPREIEFASGAPSDPYGFKPTDVIVDRDGSLLVSDWCDGQRPRRGRGRIYRISYPGAPPPAAASLDSKSYAQRCEAQAEIERRNAPVEPAKLGALGRMHAVWILARRSDKEALFGLAESDPDPRVRAQAVRALADLTDPVLVTDRLDAAPGDAAAAKRLAALGRGQDSRVALEVVLALGRLRWPETPEWLRSNLPPLDPAVAHAAQQALRASANWPAILNLLEEKAPIRAVALRALAWQTQPAVVDGLADRLKRESDPRRRREYVDVLARAYKKPAPWTYWGFRPAPRPPHTMAWDRTEAIERALDGALTDADVDVRRATLKRMKREGVSARAETLVPWLRSEREAETVSAILEAMRSSPAGPVREALAEVVRDGTHAARNRVAALDVFVRGLDASPEARLLDLAGSIEDSPVAAEVFRQLGLRPKVDAVPLLRGKLSSPVPEVRVAALEALAELRAEGVGESVLALLRDPDLRVRLAAVTGCSKLGTRQAIDTILQYATDPNPEIRRRSLQALGKFREARAATVSTAALHDRETELAALECLAAVGGPEHASALAEFAAKNGSLSVLEIAARTLARWKNERAIADVQGAGGSLIFWKLLGPLEEEAAIKVAETGAVPSGARDVFATGPESRIVASEKPSDGSSWLAFTEAAVSEPTRVQLLASSGGAFDVWLNGRRAYRRADKSAFRADSDRFEAELVAGLNRIAVRVSGPAEFHVRFRRQASTAERERFAQLALTGKGDVKRGRDIFLNVKKSNCLTCHRLGDQGGAIGPELNGVGRRFSRAYLIESILEPSRAIAPSYQNWALKLKDGRVLNGVRLAENESSFTLGDQQGAKHVFAKGDIEQQQMLSLSLMPEGLEKGLSEQEFLDLVTFLTEQK